ncbi:hypothetical protein BaRGS_00002398 [Batillaria attramentaria]|uniref:Uncharacterized protein n=1 Tax=Batillaria attramentaria TaxID=370345 RepID=A0ABD0M452_9CAEN
MVVSAQGGGALCPHRTRGVGGYRYLFRGSNSKLTRWREYVTLIFSLDNLFTVAKVELIPGATSSDLQPEARTLGARANRKWAIGSRLARLPARGAKPKYPLVHRFTYWEDLRIERDGHGDWTRDSSRPETEARERGLIGLLASWCRPCDRCTSKAWGPTLPGQGISTLFSHRVLSLEDLQPARPRNSLSSEAPVYVTSRSGQAINIISEWSAIVRT